MGKQKKPATEEGLSKQAASASELTKLAELHSNVISARDKINAPLSHFLAMLTLGLINTLNLFPLLKAGIENAVGVYTGLWLEFGVDLEDKDNETWASNVVGIGTFILGLAALFFGIRAYFNGFFALSNALFPNGFKQGLPVRYQPLLVRHQPMEAIPNDISKFRTKAEIKHLTTVLEAKQKLLSGDLRFIYFWLTIIYAFGVLSNLSKMIKLEYTKSLSADGAMIIYRNIGVALTGASTRIFHDKLFGGAIPSLIGANLIEKWRNRSARKTNATQLTQLEQLNIGQQAWTLVNADNPQEASFNLIATEPVSLKLSLGELANFSRATVIEELLFALNNTPWQVRQLDDKRVSVKGVTVLKPSWRDWLSWQQPVDQINSRLAEQFKARATIQKNFSAKHGELKALLSLHTVYPVYDRVNNIKTVKFVVPALLGKVTEVLNLFKSLYGDENVALADYSDSHIVVTGVNLADKGAYQQALKTLVSEEIKVDEAVSPSVNAHTKEVQEQQNIKRRRRSNQDSQPNEKPIKIVAPTKASFKISWPGGYIYDSSSVKQQAVFPIRVPWAPANTYFGVIKPGVEHTFFGGNGRPPFELWNQLRDTARRGTVVLNDTSGSKAGGVGTVFEQTIQDGKRYDVIAKNTLNMGLFGKTHLQRGDNGRAVLVEYDYIDFRH